MAEVLPFRQTPKTDEPFGGCPHCRQNDGYVITGPELWFVCDRHKTKWCVGWNPFSSWCDQDEEAAKRTRFKLSEYMIVKPIYPDLIMGARGHRLSRRFEYDHG